MGYDIEKFIRRNISGLGSYSAAKATENVSLQTDIPVDKIIKLDANENPYGCSPKVNKALEKYREFNIYPDTTQTPLRQLLAGYTGAGPENIVASAGSNTLLDLVIRLFVNPGDEVINCVPTFDIYRFSTQIASGINIEVQRNNDYSLNIPAIRKAITERTRLIFLANPNAPTGNLASPEEIREVLRLGIPTVVDEAYYEFSGLTVLNLMEEFGNLMVVRTFSKWAGLAGLRIGYGVFPVKIAEFLHKIKIPYNINVAALIAVEESLKDLEYLRHNVELIIRERENLYNRLKNIDYLYPFPSVANFILCRVLRGEAKALWERLEKRGILVRYFDKPGLSNCIRVSVGTPAQTGILIETLRDIGKTW